MRFHVRPGFWVGGKGLSPGSMVTSRGAGTLPPRGPLSMYSPGFSGTSPGFWIRDIDFVDLRQPANPIR